MIHYITDHRIVDSLLRRNTSNALTSSNARLTAGFDPAEPSVQVL
jgi:hypothetical protein